MAELGGNGDSAQLAAVLAPSGGDEGGGGGDERKREGNEDWAVLDVGKNNAAAEDDSKCLGGGNEERSDSDDESWYDEEVAESEDCKSSDVEMETEEDGSSKVQLDWHADPKESLSDWRIDISSEGEITKYHVHKVCLALGPCQSDYFAALLKNRGFEEHSFHVSAIELEAPYADAFPVLLAFMYHQVKGDTLPLDELHAHGVGLYRLAECFQVLLLKQRVIESIDVDNAHLYYETAVAMNPPVQDILNKIEEVCSDHILEIQPDSLLLSVVHPSFLLGILHSESFLVGFVDKENGI